jgi:hypothetical protein
MVHIARYHPDILLVRAVQLMFNPDTSEAMGAALGVAFKREFTKRYAAIAKTH